MYFKINNQNLICRRLLQSSEARVSHLAVIEFKFFLDFLQKKLCQTCLLFITKQNMSLSQF